ncbi:MAG: FAD-binding oxidoreductase [Candidatus Omnitrophica bacterium]|jgi:D-lactate dehydrogenase (cytochrome)|nr:FAD-binding oxidoreductase [Candidatus Omnitrophota bacterium]
MIIKKDPDIIKGFLEDYSNLKSGFCQDVYFAETEDDIRQALHDSVSLMAPLTITGAGTGVAGARIPFGGNVLSLEKMNSISAIRPLPDGTAEITVGAGLILKDLLEKVDQGGYFYPPDPTEKTSFVAGNISTSASGAKSFKYGATRDFVKSLRLMLSNGQILNLKRGEIFADRRRLDITTESGHRLSLTLPSYDMPRVKNAAGYYIKDDMDAIDLFIGQEGTLGIILNATLKLIKKPGQSMDCYAFFKNNDDAVSFALKAREQSLIKNTALDAACLEFFDSNALDLLRQKHDIIPSLAKGAVYFQQEIPRGDDGDMLISAWANLIARCNGLTDETWLALADKDRQRVSDIRHDVPDMVNEYLKKHNMLKIGTDMAVPHKDLPAMMKYCDNTLSGAGLKYLCFGHIGQAHLHINILPKNTAEHEKGKRVYNKLVQKAISLGGTPTAEHGIGKIKHGYLEMLYGKEAVAQMARLKKQLDPYCILGLDNIFPRHLLEPAL